MNSIAGESDAEPAGEPPVKVGTMLFTLVEPHKGHVVAYNDWYERDHQFGGATVGSGVFSHRRWISPRRLKNIRLPETGAVMQPLDAGSMLAVYWREAGIEDEHGQWAKDQWHWLNARGRIFTERTHAHTADYRLLSTIRQPGERVPIALALIHPFAGLVMTLVDVNDGTRAEGAKKLEHIAAQTLLADAAIVSTWELTWPPSPDNALLVPALAPPSANTLLQVSFLRQDPEAVWSSVRRYQALLDKEKSLKLRFAAGFIPTVPGTTKYLDEIW